MKPILLIFSLFITQFQVIAQSDTLEIINFHQSECESLPYGYKIKERLVSVEKFADFTRVEIGVFENCSGVYGAKAILENDTLKLSYKQGKLIEIRPDQMDTMENGDITMHHNIIFSECRCCFQFVIDLQGLQQTEFITTANNTLLEFSKDKYVTQPVHFDIYKGDTINYINKYGVREGLFLKDTSAHYEYFRIYNEEDTRDIKRYYYENGNLKQELSYTYLDSMKLTEFYVSGKIKSRCDTNLDKELSNCRYWNKRGKEIEKL